MRAAAMGGKFAFILVAAIKMSRADLGRFGFLSALCIIVSGVVGLEIYQVATRAIVTDAADGVRRRYRNFIVLSGLAAFAASIPVLHLMHWSLIEQVLGAAIVCTEYVGTELFRILAAERRQMQAIQSFSVRSGLWSLGLPALALVGVLPGQWSLILVMGAWLACSLAGLLYAVALPRTYKQGALDLRDTLSWVIELAPHCASWLLISLTWRFLESGGRLVAGVALQGDVAGRFTFLSSISAISLTVMKGLIEPLMFAQLAAPANVDRRRRYKWIVAVIATASAVGSAILLAGYSILSHRQISPADVQTFVVLSIGAVILNMSQVPHFVLYAHRHDRTVLATSVTAGLIAVPATLLGAKFGGELGLACGLAVGAAVLWASKGWCARGLEGQQAV